METLNSRQWWLYRLVRENAKYGKKVSVEEIVEQQEYEKASGKLPYTDLYTFAENDIYKNCPAIYEDKDIINESDEIDKILCVKNREFYLGNEQENIEYHNKLMKKVCDYSHKAKIIRDKISQDGQCKLFTFDLIEMEKSKGRDYHEAFARQESLINEIKQKDDLIMQYKNKVEQLEDYLDAYKKGNVKC